MGSTILKEEDQKFCTCVFLKSDCSVGNIIYPFLWVLKTYFLNFFHGLYICIYNIFLKMQMHVDSVKNENAVYLIWFLVVMNFTFIVYIEKLHEIYITTMIFAKSCPTIFIPIWKLPIKSIYNCTCLRWSMASFHKVYVFFHSFFYIVHVLD